MSRLAAPAEGIASSMVLVGGSPLALLDVGPPGAPTLVLVPGFTGSKEDFAPLLPALAAAGFRAVAIDQRGQYESPGPEDRAAYATEVLASDLLGLLRVLDRGPVHLVGHSFGGLVARAAALARPEAARSLTLLGSGPAGLDGPRGQVIAALGPLLEQLGPAQLWDTLSATAPSTPFARERFLRSSPAGLVGMAEALLHEPDRTVELAALVAAGLPVLVAHGAGDDAWTPTVQREMATALGARYAVIPDALHSPGVENPVATAAVLVRFLQFADGG
ncbi:MAG: alpha/beta fold hydrolase [Mycobacteriales bacterium]